MLCALYYTLRALSMLLGKGPSLRCELYGQDRSPLWSPLPPSVPLSGLALLLFSVPQICLISSHHSAPVLSTQHAPLPPLFLLHAWLPPNLTSSTFHRVITSTILSYFQNQVTSFIRAFIGPHSSLQGPSQVPVCIRACVHQCWSLRFHRQHDLGNEAAPPTILSPLSTTVMDIG